MSCPLGSSELDRRRDRPSHGMVDDQMRPRPRTNRPQSLRSVVAISLALAFTLIAALAHAESVDVLADRLQNASDFRVRVQAALALGTSNDSAAVKPLCDGLDDSNTAVRSAAAAALGRLGMKSGVSCLKNRLGSESNASVTAQIRRSIGQIESGGSSKP